VKHIYFDHAATTREAEEVSKAIKMAAKNSYGNPDSSHNLGLSSSRLLEKSRKIIANAFNCKSDEVIFTSGGTESNNIAILGAYYSAQKNLKTGRLHAISSTIEHSSVLNVMRRLIEFGVDVDFVKPNENGEISIHDVINKLRPETFLISIMHANNETGVVNNVRKLYRAIIEASEKIKFNIFNRPLLHTDACQNPMYSSINRESLGADLISIDAHKIHGPKGVGALYISKDANITPITYGGGQEEGYRPGTVAVPLVAGFSEAIVLAEKSRMKWREKVQELSRMMENEIQKNFSDALIVGSKTLRLPNIVSVVLPNIDAELVCMRLSSHGIYISSKSACLGNEKGSYVIEEILGGSKKNEALRFSFDHTNTKKEVREVIKVLRLLSNKNLLRSSS
jgi:cysteine desulfurase